MAQTAAEPPAWSGPPSHSNTASSASAAVATGRYVMYLAVVPHYRQACIDELWRRLGGELRIYAGHDNLDRTVTTGVRIDQYDAVCNRFLLGRRLMYQTGHWRAVLAADTAILDLNPRNLSVWILTMLRRLMRRRTLHWGHLHPRGGPSAGTAALRKALRRLGEGTVLYGFEQAEQAAAELPGKPTWVAANALYPTSMLWGAYNKWQDRTHVIYVGRLVAGKKVDVLIRAFAHAVVAHSGATLVLVGDGDQRQSLERLVRSLGLDGQVAFTGALTAPHDLRNWYRKSFVSVSPGYVGLGLTQSLGFGVPQLASRNEPHSPEIELAAFGAVTYFETDNPADLAVKIEDAWSARPEVDSAQVAEPILRRYTSEAMADGLVNAFRGASPTLPRAKEVPLNNSPASRSRIPNLVSKPTRSILKRIALSGQVRVGRNFRAALGASVSSQHGLTIGDFASIGRRTSIDVDGTIGHFFLVGTGVLIVGRNDHAYDEVGVPLLNSTWVGDRPADDRDRVNIGDDVWIGAGSVVLSGLTIGSGAIVAAGSVVTRNVAPMTIVAGNPAVFVKNRFKSDTAEAQHVSTLTRSPHA